MKSLFLLLFLFTTALAFSQTETSTQQETQLIVYGIDDCHYCHDSRALLDKNKVEYIFYDVDKNIAKRKEMIEGLKAASVDLKNLNIPVIKKSGKYLINDGDFDQFLEKLIPFTKDHVSKS